MTPLPTVRPLFYAVYLLYEHNNNIIIIILGISAFRRWYYYGIGFFSPLSSRSFFWFLIFANRPRRLRRRHCSITMACRCIHKSRKQYAYNLFILYTYRYTGAPIILYSLTIDDADQIVIRFLTQCCGLGVRHFSHVFSPRRGRPAPLSVNNSLYLRIYV